MKKIIHLQVLLAFAFLTCGHHSSNNNEVKNSVAALPELEMEFDKNTNTIHILVALCDNENQGIVPVPKIFGNGSDPKNNLYWGAMYGIKTYFKKSAEWQLLQTKKMDDVILERLIFKHRNKNFYIVADAYDGKYIKKTTEKFLRSSAGISKGTLKVDNRIIGIEGNSKLVAYIGHDGLMDFQLEENFENKDGLQRDAIILACISEHYFKPYIKAANANPLVWTTGLMAPEAYTIHDALAGYVNGESNEQIRTRAAKAYAKYQKCGESAARHLLTTGTGF